MLAHGKCTVWPCYMSVNGGWAGIRLQLALSLVKSICCSHRTVLGQQYSPDSHRPLFRAKQTLHDACSAHAHTLAGCLAEGVDLPSVNVAYLRSTSNMASKFLLIPLPAPAHMRSSFSLRDGDTFAQQV